VEQRPDKVPGCRGAGGEKGMDARYDEAESGGEGPYIWDGGREDGVGVCTGAVRGSIQSGGGGSEQEDLVGIVEAGGAEGRPWGREEC